MRVMKKSEDKKWKDIATGSSVTNVYVPTVSASANAYRFKVTDIAQGDDYNQRSGNDVYVKGMQLGYRVEHSHNVSDEYTLSARIMVVLDRNIVDLLGSSPHVTDILANPSTNAGWLLTQGTAVNQMFGGKRFQILYDKVVSVTADPSTTSSSTFGPNNCAARYRPLWIPIKKKVSFNTSAGAAFGKNQVYVYVFSNEGNTSTGTGPRVNMTIRTFFTG